MSSIRSDSPAIRRRIALHASQMIMSDFGGEVPRDMKSLQKLPGVGRKTANIVLNEGFGIVEGIAVDTHVFRIAHRLKFSNADTPLQTEQDLLKLYPRECWGPKSITNGCCSDVKPASRANRNAPNAS